ncbi:MAG: dihydrolipoyl dehydrogenase, partial [Zoogloeaceae bacterium]|nr:dihydrolipoyl dehydrogenase [Zoogloeaceae bacterium]
MALTEIKVPDIGDFAEVPVIEILVKPGDTVAAEDALVTLESDKATMEVPSPAAGVVREVCVQLGEKVSEGSLLFKVETDAAASGATPAA